MPKNKTSPMIFSQLWVISCESKTFKNNGKMEEYRVKTNLISSGQIYVVISEPEFMEWHFEGPQTPDPTTLPQSLRKPVVSQK